MKVNEKFVKCSGCRKISTINYTDKEITKTTTCMVCGKITTYQLKKMKLKKEELKQGYYIFGNKGNVWTDTAHIAKSGEPMTMCGTPMLSSNWAKLEDVKEIGCPKCLAKYNQN
jgi:hypothetical protein